MRRAILATLIALCSTATLAAETEYWLERASDLARGEASSIAISRRGELFLSPASTKISKPELPGQPSFSLVLRETSDGTVYVGTGPSGRILEFSSSGRGEVFAELDAPLVTALAPAPNGALYASASPSGTVERIAADGKRSVWVETESRYIWDIVIDADGSLILAAGEPAALLRVSPDRRVETLATFADDHLRTLLPLGADGWLAGSSGFGRVYQIDREGHVLVLHDDDLPEVTDLVQLRDGTIFATVLDSPVSEPSRPAVTIRLPGSESSAGPDAFGVLDDADNSVLRGVIEGLPTEDAPRSSRVRGKLMRIDRDGSVAQVWRSSGGAALGLAVDRTGTVLFGTGEPARLYRVERDQVSLLQTFAASQASALGGAGRPLVATSSPVELHRLEPQTEDSGTFVSRVFDAATMTRWGSIRWTELPGSGRVEFYTRTGNSSSPDESWSGWSPALSNAAGSPIINPEGRFAQWKMRLVGAGIDGLRVRDVRVSYRPLNRRPRMRDLRLEGNTRAFDASATLRWSAMDPDKDPARVSFEARLIPGGDWQAVAADSMPSSLLDTSRRSGWREDQRTWDTSEFAPGTYQLRAQIDDLRSNTPGEGKVWTYPLQLEIAIDHNAPELELVRRDSAEVEVWVRDAHSAIRNVSFFVDNRPRYTVQPVDGVIDSSDERFLIPIPTELSLDSRWALRATDEAGNFSELVLRDSPEGEEP